MPAYMTQRSSSAGLGKIRRELERRRKLAAVAKGGVAKKSSAPPPPPPQRGSAPIPLPPGGAAAREPSTAPIPPAPAGAAAKKSSAPPRSASSSISRSPRREFVPARARTTAPPLPSPVASESVKRGTTVRVRTRVGTLPTGQCLVLWLSAVVVSAAEEGYLEVIYNGDFPRDDPFRTVRVARDEVKNMPQHQ